jgi:hypothetical protein
MNKISQSLKKKFKTNAIGTYLLSPFKKICEGIPGLLGLKLIFMGFYGKLDARKRMIERREREGEREKER